MDLTKLVMEDRYGEKFISGENIKDILGTKDDMIRFYITSTSVFKNSYDIGGGFFSPQTYDKIHVLAKDLTIAKNKFDEIYTEIIIDHWCHEANFELPYMYADFLHTHNSKPLSFLPKWDAFDMITYGRNLRVALKQLDLPLESIVYNPSKNTLCHTFQDSYEMEYFVPIILE